MKLPPNHHLWAQLIEEAFRQGLDVGTWGKTIGFWVYGRKKPGSPLYPREPVEGTQRERLRKLLNWLEDGKMRRAA
jgi:hypothetical protein